MKVMIDGNEHDDDEHDDDEHDGGYMRAHRYRPHNHRHNRNHHHHQISPSQQCSTPNRNTYSYDLRLAYYTITHLDLRELGGETRKSHSPMNITCRARSLQHGMLAMQRKGHVRPPLRLDEQ